MGSLSINNLIVSIGVAFDAQLKAADNLFFSAAVDFTDPTRPMFGGALGTASGASTTLYNAAQPGVGYSSANNAISGDPVTVRQTVTAEGPRYQVTDGNGREIKIEAQSTAGPYRNIPRYMVKSDGIVYDVLSPTTTAGTGQFGICDNTKANGSPGLTSFAPGANGITIAEFARPVGRITFKAKEGATLARAQDDLQRVGSIVQLLTRLLESVQDESKGFSSLIR
ncbi:MAG: hypothetical protein U0354_11205 [Candidatus Sericytochromatia bacterium]